MLYSDLGNYFEFLFFSCFSFPPLSISLFVCCCVLVHFSVTLFSFRRRLCIFAKYSSEIISQEFYAITMNHETVFLEDSLLSLFLLFHSFFFSSFSYFYIHTLAQNWMRSDSLINYSDQIFLLSVLLKYYYYLSSFPRLRILARNCTILNERIK